ncbi:MAG: PorP/SprF family type IX secretion system membrane protein [Bacteroidetes bacterium]|nr:PorP/SprF family type IX secretion system membrane protein [Bacteroidota bacterium]
MKKNGFLLVFSILICVAGFAQDPGFSQFFASPLTLNPALTGKFNGDLRVAGNYRNQWPTIDNAFITSTASVDMPIAQHHLPENNIWGVGIMGMSDKTASGILTSNYFSLSTAYHLPLDIDGYSSLGLGFQGTYASKILDGTRLHLEDQLDQQGGWTIPSADAISTRAVTVNYFDMNVGLLYNLTTTGANNFYFGTSIYHINRPKQSFLGTNTYTLNPRITVHGGLSQPISNDSYIHFSGLYSNQAGAHQIEVGGAWSVNVNHNLDDPINFYAGSWARFSNVTDAIIPYVGLEFSSFTLGFSYDVNISSLKSASQSQGGIEISLIYIKKPSDGRKQIPCPKY